MPRDINGREIPNLSEADLLGGTSSTNAGSSKELDGLLKIIEESEKSRKEFSGKIDKAVGSVDGLSKKLDDIDKTMKAIASEARKAPRRNGSGESLKGALSKGGMAKIFGEIAKGSKGSGTSKTVDKIYQQISSKHTVYVRDTGMAKIGQRLVSSVDQIAVVLGTLSSRANRLKGTSSSPLSKENLKEEHEKTYSEMKGSAFSEDTMEGIAEGARDASESLGSAHSWAEGLGAKSKEFASDLKRSHSILSEFTYDFLKQLKESGREGETKAIIRNLQVAKSLSARWSESNKKAVDQAKSKVELVEQELSGLEEGEAKERKIAEFREKAMKEYIEQVRKANKELVSVNRRVSEGFSKVKQKVDEFSGFFEKFGSLYGGVSVKSYVDPAEAIRNRVKGNKLIRQAIFAQGELAEKNIEVLKLRQAQYETGADALDIQKSLAKNLSAGIKDRSKALKITKQGLQLGYQLNMNATETADMMRRWNQHLDIGEDKMGLMNRGIQSAARLTGLVGDEMNQVLLLAEKFGKKMRSIGASSVESMTKVVELLALAKKTGIEDQTGGFIDLLSGGFPNLMNQLGSNPMANLVLESAQKGGVLKEVTSGLGMTEYASKGMGEGLQMVWDQKVGRKLESFGKEFSNVLGGKEIKSFRDLMMSSGRLRDLAKANEGTAFGEEAKRAYEQSLRLEKSIQSVTELTYGVKPVDFEKLVENYKEANKTFAEKMAALKDKDTKNLSDLQKANHEFLMASMQFNESAKLLDTGKFATNTDSLARFLVDSKKFSDMESATKAVEGMGQDERQELTVRSMVDAINQAQAQAMDQGISRSELGKGFTESDIQDALGSDKGMESFMERAQTSMSQTENAMKKLQDPQTRMEQHLKNIHAILQDTLGNSFIKWATKLSFLLLPLTSISVMLSQFLGIATSGKLLKGVGKWLLGKGKGAGKWLKGLFGFGDDAAKAAGGAGKAVGGARKGVGLLGKAGGILGKAGRFLGPAAGIAAGGMGLYSGIANAEEAGQGFFKGKGFLGKAESGLLGLLTGGAEKGSMFSGMLGLKKGGAADEALGVLGSTAHGASVGAAVGSVVPVVGTAVGGAVGAIAGAGAELYKVFTDKKSPLRKTLTKVGDLVNPLSPIIDGFKSASNAAELFGVKQEEVTLGMRASAAAAGTATGALNKLTFGAFDKYLGTDGVWTKKLAGFFNSAFDGYSNLLDGIRSGFVKAIKYIKLGILKTINSIPFIGDSIVSDESVEKLSKELSNKSKSESPTAKDASKELKKSKSETPTAKDASKELKKSTASTSKKESDNDSEESNVQPKVPGSSKSPKHIDEKLREDRISSKGDPKEIDYGKELLSMSKNTTVMMNKMTIISEQLTKFVNMMSQSMPNEDEPYAESGDPRSNKAARGASSSYTWNVGNYDQNPNKGPVTTKHPS